MIQETILKGLSSIFLGTVCAIGPAVLLICQYVAIPHEKCTVNAVLHFDFELHEKVIHPLIFSCSISFDFYVP